MLLMGLFFHAHEGVIFP